MDRASDRKRKRTRDEHRGFIEDLKRILGIKKQKLVDRQVEEIRKRERYRRFVESLKKKKVPPEVYRELIVLPLDEGEKMLAEWEKRQQARK